MIADNKLPIVATAVQAWVGAGRAIAAMPLTSAVGLGCLVATALAGDYALGLMLPPPQSPLYLSASDALPALLVTVAFGVVQSVLLTPFLIAVHRHVLLRQITRGYPLGLSNARFMRYAGFAVLAYVLLSVPALVNRSVEMSTAVELAVTMVLNIAILAVLLRHVVLFPAIAVDAERVDWRRARLLTTGHTWRVFFVMLCVFLPFLVLAVPMHYFYVWGIVTGEFGAIAYRAVAFVAQLVALAIFAAASSRIYGTLDPGLGQELRPTPSVVAARR